MLVEVVTAAGALVIDVLARLQGFERLGPFARQNDFAGRRGNFAQRGRYLAAIGCARLLQCKQGEEGRIISLVDEGLVGAFLELGIVEFMELGLGRIVGGRSWR